MYKPGNYEWVAGRLAETAKWLDEHKKFKDWSWEHLRRGRSSKRNPERTSGQVGGTLGELSITVSRAVDGLRRMGPQSHTSMVEVGREVEAQWWCVRRRAAGSKERALNSDSNGVT